MAAVFPPLAGPMMPGVAGPAVPYGALGPAGAPLGTPLVNITGAGPNIAPAVTAPPGPLPVPAAGANLAALGLPAAGAPNGPAVLNASFPGGMDAWAAAMSNAQLGASTIQNSNVIAEKANDMRKLFFERAEEIYERLITIRNTAAPLQAQAQAAVAARAALVELINAVNAQGYIDPNQAAALHNLANELNNLDIQGIINAVVGEINQLADAVGLARPRPAAGYAVNANDAAANPLVGGRRKRKKGKKTRRKKHKGGFKYTRLARSRRSLRMSRRKSLRRQHKKHKKHKTKKHRRRRRRR